MDDYDSSAKSAEKLPGGEDEGSMAPLPKKVRYLEGRPVVRNFNGCLTSSFCCSIPSKFQSLILDQKDFPFPSAVLDEQVSVETEKLSSDTDGDIFTDEGQKLPSINDSFWEQFFMVSPLSGDVEDVDSGTYKAKEMQPE